MNIEMLAAVRQPILGETPLSDAEIEHGARHGLIALVPVRVSVDVLQLARARAFSEAGQ